MDIEDNCFKLNSGKKGWLVSRQTRVQLPDSYICAKLVDFALSAVEEMVRHFDVTTSDYKIVGSCSRVKLSS